MKLYNPSALLLQFTLSAALAGCQHTDYRDNQPHIILIMADDQGWGDMGYNGHPVVKTPNFDNLASSGISFNRFYAAAPVCSPTRGSVMTGRNPNRFGCFSWGNTLRPQEITIASVLKSAGYVTGHFGKWHLGSVLEEGMVNPGKSGFDEWLSAPNFFENDPILSHNGKAVQLFGESSEVTVDAAIEFLRKNVDSKQPIFAVVWFGSPHGPHIAAPQDSAIYPEEEPHLQHFYGEITGMDRAMGKLRQELKILGISDNTLLWYCSDNGGLPGVGSTGGRAHKGNIYDGGLRVPAIIEWPARFKYHRTTQLPATTSDIFPTLLAAAGIEHENHLILDGINLLPAITEGIDKRKRPLVFWQIPENGRPTPSQKWMKEILQAQENGMKITDPALLASDAGEMTRKFPEDVLPGHAAILDWPWKLHRIQKDSENLNFELYNLEKDSMETVNLAPHEIERVDELRPTLEAWQKSVIKSLNGNEYSE